MSEVRVNNLSNESLSGGPTISGITTFSSPYFFVPPQGDTVSRPQDCPPGSLRFNTDSSHLEYYRGDTIGWVEVEAELTEPLGGGTGSNADALGTRGIFVGGYSPSHSTDIQFITISTLGDSQDFGDLNNGFSAGVATNDRTRGFYSGGNYGNQLDMRFCTLASTGDSVDGGGDLILGNPHTGEEVTFDYGPN